MWNARESLEILGVPRELGILRVHQKLTADC